MSGSTSMIPSPANFDLPTTVTSRHQSTPSIGGWVGEPSGREGGSLYPIRKPNLCLHWFWGKSMPRILPENLQEPFWSICKLYSSDVLVIYPYQNYYQSYDMPFVVAFARRPLFDPLPFLFLNQSRLPLQRLNKSPFERASLLFLSISHLPFLKISD